MLYPFPCTARSWLLRAVFNFVFPVYDLCGIFTEAVSVLRQESEDDVRSLGGSFPEAVSADPPVDIPRPEPVSANLTLDWLGQPSIVLVTIRAFPPVIVIVLSQ